MVAPLKKESIKVKIWETIEQFVILGETIESEHGYNQAAWEGEGTTGKGGQEGMFIVLAMRLQYVTSMRMK